MQDSAFTARDLIVLGETAESSWVYIALTPLEGPETLLATLERYSAAADQEDARAEFASIFGAIEAFEPYGPEDRRGPGLDQGAAIEGPTVVDVRIWPSAGWAEASQRVEKVREVVVQLALTVHQ